MIKYRAFIKVAELGSITKAAKELGYSQPGVSHMLDALESEVGFPLLVRSKDKIQPTEDGKRILNCCYQIVKYEDDLKDVVQSISGLITGSLSIGALNSMLVSYVPRVTSKFLDAYSNIKIKIHEYPYSGIQEQLLNGTLDIAFTSECKAKGIEFHPLFKDHVCVVMPETHPFASYDKVPVSSLNGCDFIMPISGWDDLITMVQKKSNFAPNIKHYVASDAAGISMAAENLGVYVLSKLQTGYLPKGMVVKEFEEDVYRIMGFAVRSLKTSTPAMQEFIKTAKTVINQSPDDYNSLL